MDYVKDGGMENVKLKSVSGHLATLQQSTGEVKDGLCHEWRHGEREVAFGEWSLATLQEGHGGKRGQD